jgi:hypothetical protein
VLSIVRLLAAAVCLGVFLWFFDDKRPQLLVDGLWVLAILLWGSEVWSRSARARLRLRPRSGDVWSIAAILATFIVAWLPFYDNWRWAYTGDSFGVFEYGYRLGRSGLTQNLLSVHGEEDSFTYLWGVAYGLPVLLFDPTFFWHRCGQLMMSCLSLAAIYIYFAVVLGRYWSAAIVISTAINYVWLWFSYVSYGKIDSFIFEFLTLAFATLIWRQPDWLIGWMLCGLIGGLSVFFTPTAWSAVAFVGLLLGAFALATRRVGAGVVYAVSFVLVALPVIIKLPWLLTMTANQTHQTMEWDYLRLTFSQVLLLPYHTNTYNIGIQGAWVRWPLGPLYVVGAGWRHSVRCRPCGAGCAFRPPPRCYWHCSSGRRRFSR